MLTDLRFLEEWIPERMDPGTVFVLENQAKLGNAQNPYVAVMSCPRCGTMGLITRRQLCAGEAMICGGDACSAEYRLDGDNILFRIPQWVGLLDRSLDSELQSRARRPELPCRWFSVLRVSPDHPAN